MSHRDCELYAGLAEQLVGQGLCLSLPTNSIKLMASRDSPKGKYIWIDPPWVLLKGEVVVATGDAYPDPDGPEYLAKHEAWGAAVRPCLEGAVLERVRTLPDGSAEFIFTQEVRLLVSVGEPYDAGLWYDDWYAKGERAGERADAGIIETALGLGAASRCGATLYHC